MREETGADVIGALAESRSGDLRQFHGHISAYGTGDQAAGDENPSQCDV